MIEKPNTTPNCCGKFAEWIVQGVNLAYFYCRECKKEVPTKKEELKSDDGNWHWNGGFLVGRWSGKEPNIMILPKDFSVDYGELEHRILVHERALDTGCCEFDVTSGDELDGNAISQYPEEESN